MVPPKKTATEVTNGANKRDISGMSFQKKDTLSGKADAKVQNGTYSQLDELAPFASIH
jgi:hypothetical protein